jgi:hypothetical protein
VYNILACNLYALNQNKGEYLMYKKLIAMAVSLDMVFSNAAPAFASYDADAAEGTMRTAVALHPYMPQGTVIPEIPEETETLPES